MDTTGQTYEYGSYEEALAHAGTTEQPFQYNGRHGRHNGCQRFVSYAYACTLNCYAYVNGNPISYIDPFGLSRDGDSIWLQGGSFIHDALPYVGTLKGFQQAFSGVNQVTGSRLSTSERWSEGVGSALSFILITGMKHVGKYGIDGIVSLGKKLDLQFFCGKSEIRAGSCFSNEQIKKVERL
ncbi:pre-toxin TG domain-containing protein [Sporosarcina beigongshangi]|uniref:pre-toxin TG domain-containing protein n=1 Tax=Sporosarcina beigongshangi TaxID=2782538 RepID=UPI001E60AD49|nr:pre-toxin TG domain-containing protein [Sporosarcina beigongshangi]